MKGMIKKSAEYFGDKNGEQGNGSRTFTDVV
jgi:hypothetical protein